MPNFHSARPLILLILIPVLLFTGCGSSGSDPDEPPVYSPLQVLVPEAPGKKTLGTSPLVLDISDTDQGYLTAVSDSTDQMMNVQLTAEDGVVYSYFISPGESAVIPFSSGSSTYQVSCYQQISDSQYAALYADTLEIKLANEFLPFLYPNQYVNFTPDSEASKLALSMVSEDTSDIDALQIIYNYVVSHVTYDYDLADTVASGYLPNVDETLQTGKGICFDYAALTAAMLRSCDIPCKLQIGYAGDIKHAWINVYIRSRGWVDKAVEFSGDSWSRMDPTFDSNSEDKDTIQEYIGDNNNYTVQFTR
ncbi:transglutaminase-like domain-containing protein [Blautia luti]|uniref:transglutaminase-like domain-containing protein n=1 Tax=Blautia luti TaxID=89014 RepID=UPI0018AA28F2|nr:transglutaminase-like domain-containing protein [Blautia luti]